MSQKTVFITGSSTGIGKLTALYFQEKGWNVSATMRNPDQNMQKIPNMICPYLDVTQKESIESAIKETQKHFGKIDVLINNAGYGLIGPFEGMQDEQINRQFETNVLGLIRVTKALVPHFRENQSGVILNISSLVGKVTFPFYSLYCSTKWAVEGFTESLFFELEPFGISVKLVEPGSIQTDFHGRSQDHSLKNSPDAYKKYMDLVSQNMEKNRLNASFPEEVAQVIFKAATDKKSKLRYPVGKNAGSLLLLRKLLPDSLFIPFIKMISLK